MAFIATSVTGATIPRALSIVSADTFFASTAQPVPPVLGQIWPRPKL